MCCSLLHLLSVSFSYDLTHQLLSVDNNFFTWWLVLCVCVTLVRVSVCVCVCVCVCVTLGVFGVCVCMFVCVCVMSSVFVSVHFLSIFSTGVTVQERHVSLSVCVCVCGCVCVYLGRIAQRARRSD